jgi:arylsulfatase A-like enzyme
MNVMKKTTCKKIVVLTTILASIFGFSANAKERAPSPNIILFVVDDMGLMDTSVPFIADKNGNPIQQPLNRWYKTPNMEKLANTGIRYSNFYAHSVCSPSRASILTGQNSTRHKTTTWIDPKENNAGTLGPQEWNWAGLTKNDITLPKVLKENGYQTIFIGKGHLAPFKHEGEDPLNVGFNVNIGGSAIGHPGSYLGQNNYQYKKGKFRYAVPHLEKYYGTDTFLTEALTLEANKEITKAVSNKKPFFVEMSHYAIHSPFTHDNRFINNYNNNNDYSDEAKRYASMVEGMDKSLGDIITHIKTLGVADNTLILFVGDNGSDAPLGGLHDIASSAPLRGQKGTHYEGGMRVPFIASWGELAANNVWQKTLPIASGSIQTQLSSIMDIYPTITELLNISDNKHKVDGYALHKTLNNQSDTNKPKTFLMHYPHEHRSSYFTSYRNGDWKLVYHYFPSVVPKGKKHTNYNVKQIKHELYNLGTDPSEQKNLAKSSPEKLQEMLVQMKKQLETEGAQLPKGYTYSNML